MKTENWLIINKNGIVGTRKSKPDLQWNEIAVKICLDIPNVLFERPTLTASLKIGEDICNTSFDAELIANTAALVEQQTGSKIVIQIENINKENL